MKAMCDLIPPEIWENIESTFLEPACGNGNFLVEILARKYKHCKDEHDGVKALTSVVGIDIQSDNCQESRKRLLDQYISRFPWVGKEIIDTVERVLQKNIICGNSLEIMDAWRTQ